MLVSHSHRQSVKCSMRSNHDCWTALFWSCCTMSLYMNIQNSFYYCYNYREVSLSNHVSHIQCNLFCNELLLFVSLRLWHPVIWIYLIFFFNGIVFSLCNIMYVFWESTYWDLTLCMYVCFSFQVQASFLYWDTWHNNI